MIADQPVSLSARAVPDQEYLRASGWLVAPRYRFSGQLLMMVRGPQANQAAGMRPAASAGLICAAASSRWGDLLVARLRDQGWPGDRHAGDFIPWVHADDLAEMSWLAATHPAAAGGARAGWAAGSALRHDLPLLP
jgi:hypothetical protein